MPNASIYISADLLKQLNARRAPGSGEVPGKQVRDLAERALAVLEGEIRGLRGALTEKEWLLIFDSLNGVETDAALIETLTGNIEDNVVLNSAATRFDLSGTDIGALVDKIDAMPAGTKWAIVDVAERFWALGVEASAEGLKRLGVVCRE